MMRRTSLLPLVLLGGCLMRNAEPRFYRPGSAMLAAAAADEREARVGRGVPIRLRGVRAEPFLRERIVWRTSEVEYGLYEQRRWIDLPAHYVERALETRLRSTPGVRLTDDVRAAAVHIDVLAFEEVLAPTHAAHVALAFGVEDPVRGRLLERTVDARVAIADARPASMAQAMGEALDDAVGQVAAALRAGLVTSRATPPR